MLSSLIAYFIYFTLIFVFLKDLPYNNKCFYLSEKYGTLDAKGSERKKEKNGISINRRILCVCSNFSPSPGSALSVHRSDLMHMYIMYVRVQHRVGSIDESVNFHRTYPRRSGDMRFCIFPHSQFDPFRMFPRRGSRLILFVYHEP